MFLKLEGRQVLVVGAGRIGEPKIGGLLETGARIRVVSLDASPTVREWARAGKLELDLRAFTAADLDGAFLAVVATNSRTLNERVYREAQKRGVLCNVVDVPDLCDFFSPAVVRRGVQPRAQARRWPRKFASSWKNNLAPATPRGSLNSARLAG
jgi:siroheme synthase-like protein